MTKSNKTKRHKKMDGQLLQFQYHHDVYENQQSHLQLVQHSCRYVFYVVCVRLQQEFRFRLMRLIQVL